MDYVVEVVAEVLARRAELGGYKITWQAPQLRHFSCHFERA
jgi:tryptophanase